MRNRRRKRLIKRLIKCAIILVVIILIIIIAGVRHKKRSGIEPIHLEPIHIEVVKEKMQVEKAVEEKETTEQVAESKEVYPDYTQEDVNLLGNTIFHEVGILFYKISEEDAIKAARMTGACLVNRAEMNYHFLGTTLQSQLVPSQYASVDKITDTRQEEVPERFYEIAEDILQNGHEFSERLVFQSEFSQGENIDHIYNQYFGLVPESEYRAYLKKI